MFWKNKTRNNLKLSFGEIKEDDFNFELITKYFRKKRHDNVYHILSDKTCNDLDFNEVFKVLDRTGSKIGQQYLYNRLRVFEEISDEQSEVKENIINEIEESNIGFDIYSELNQLNNDEAFYIRSLFQDDHLQPPKWFFVVPLLSITSLLSIVMMWFNPYYIFLLLTVLLVNIVIHFWNKRNLNQYIGSIPQLLKLKKISKKLFQNEILKKVNSDLPSAFKVLDEVHRRMSIFKMELKVENEVSGLIWSIIELIKITFILEPILLFGVLKRLDNRRSEIETVFDYVGEIDMLVTISLLRKEFKTCKPVINNQKSILTENIYHPLVKDCVSNSLSINDKSVLLTGSNMSGKTTFIRTIGVNFITGITLNTCFANSMTFPLMKLYSAIRISDDLLNDKSYYFEEVLTIKEMIDESKGAEPCLFLLDEIFKGTNTVERISAGKAVLSSLNKLDNIVFVSTHDIELADLLKDEYDLFHFSEVVTSKEVDFDYLLKEGKLKNRNAIRILEINNYPVEVIKEALQLSDLFDQKAGVVK